MFGIAAIVSAFMVGLREDKRSIHDFVAGTYVTYAEPGETEMNNRVLRANDDSLFFIRNA